MDLFYGNVIRNTATDNKSQGMDCLCLFVESLSFLFLSFLFFSLLLMILWKEHVTHFFVEFVKHPHGCPPYFVLAFFCLETLHNCD